MSMTALQRLQSLLQSHSSAAQARPWAVEQSIDGHIARLRRRLKSPGSSTPPDALQEAAVRRFWPSMQLDTFKEARLVSFGLALSVGPQRQRVIEDDARFSALLSDVDKYLPNKPLYRHCYMGLFNGYFAYDPDAKATPRRGKENWNHLRHYLGERAPQVLGGRSNPQWTETLQQHHELFTPNPCVKYGARLLTGDRTEVDELRSVLRIPDSAWFMRKLFLAQIEAAVAKDDPGFLEVLQRALDLIEENALIRDEGLALVLDRFAVRSGASTVHAALRNAAVNNWGNPWLQLNAMRWGRVTPAARAMVTEWLKLEFIEDFFTLLAEDGTGDTRRLEFWKRYVHSMDDVHFALGQDALTSPAPDFVALRKKMAGLATPLQGTVRANNAFVMHMGPVVMVEFSGQGNACYGYDGVEKLPFQYDAPLVTSVNARNSLKHSSRVLWMNHQDNVHGFDRWEDRFEHQLAALNLSPKSARPAAPAVRRVIPAQVQERPRVAPGSSAALAAALSGRREAPVAARLAPHPTATRPAPPPPVDDWLSGIYSRKALDTFAERHGFVVEDLTRLNGNLWVRADAVNPHVNRTLENWGFVFKNSAKGWWKAR